MLATSEGETLFIFIDESGNFDFSPSGTKFFVLAAVSTRAPLASRDRLLNKAYELKYEGWKTGQADYFFHATEDRQEVRDFVFSAVKNLDDLNIDAIVAQKNKTPPKIYTKTISWPQQKTVKTDEHFYAKMLSILLQDVFARYDGKVGIGDIVVALGSLFTGKKREYVLKELKGYLKKKFNKPFHIYFHPTPSDINCQIADYCGWAIYVRAERDEQRPFNEIKSKVRSNFDVFKKGKTKFYAYNK